MIRVALLVVSCPVMKPVRRTGMSKGTEYFTPAMLTAVMLLD